MATELPLGLPLGDLLLSLLVIYFAYFTIIPFIVDRGYLASNPAAKPSNQKEKRDETKTEKEYAVYEKQGIFSQTLTGFSIAALTFVITIFKDDLLSVQELIVFFSIAFVCESASMILYRHATRRGYKYFGNMTQLLGIFALLNGFFVYIIDSLWQSIILWVIFISGYIVFLVFSIKELNVFIQMMRKWGYG